ncbi:hypothetical protein [Streptomyces sp. NPDC006996]|uniref:hypothetical protein n=1 Tax=Streptomyces sp. NPDC006996 TaxID=3156908 RepID=UPI0033EB5E5C
MLLPVRHGRPGQRFRDLQHDDAYAAHERVEGIAQLRSEFLDALQSVGLIGELDVHVADSPVQLADHMRLLHQVQVGVAATAAHPVAVLCLY